MTGTAACAHKPGPGMIKVTLRSGMTMITSATRARRDMAGRRHGQGYPPALPVSEVPGSRAPRVRSSESEGPITRPGRPRVCAQKGRSVTADPIGGRVDRSRLLLARCQKTGRI